MLSARNADDSAAIMLSAQTGQVRRSGPRAGIREAFWWGVVVVWISAAAGIVTSFTISVDP